MGALDNLTFAKKAPAAAKRTGASPLEKGRKKLLADIGHQIALARDPNYEIVTTGRGGSEKRRKPKSWVQTVDDGVAYLAIRYSNKVMPIGGRAGSLIKVSADGVVDALSTVKGAVESGELDGMIETMIQKAKRGKRNG